MVQLQMQICTRSSHCSARQRCSVRALPRTSTCTRSEIRPTSTPTPQARADHVGSARTQFCGAHGRIPGDALVQDVQATRRSAFFIGGLTIATAASPSYAIDTNPLTFKKTVNKRRRKIPPEEYKDGPEGLKYYDIEVGGGAEAKTGNRIAIHYDVKYRGITFMTSRQGMGVTGGTPLGFDVGVPTGSAGSTLPGIDLGVRGMRVGGIRRLLVPPELGYGKRGIGEIPPNTTLEVDVELLSIKTTPFGYRTKLVEG